MVRSHSGVGQLRLRLRIGLEAGGQIGLELGQIALWIQRGLATLGGYQGDLSTGVLEHIIRSGEFLEPEAGLVTSITELVMGSQYEQDLHKNHPSMG